ncbi:hypothetical protein BXT84_00015 [Sulfobacillus thermotolerans]|uniref:TLC domain-containing protein n=1 Tax=Sulfobacillus thermotolerans TaxID=338644 RepID=A0ABN5GZE8_9FIRM|nr:hypothetical protein BXT84_00015 [Sulfobacillus thermotolerans]
MCAALLIIAAVHGLYSWAGVALGLIAGWGMAVLSLHTTQFSRRTTEVSYTVSSIGESIVIACFALRFGLEFGHIQWLHPRGIQTPQAIVVHHALSMFIYLLFLAYWISFYEGLYQKARKFFREADDLVIEDMDK